MTSRQRRVSVIIPVFNGEASIARAIQSALAQDYSELEVLAIDDGSTDRTAEVVRGFGDRVVYCHQHNQERSVARNTGLALAQGEFIAFLDADDWWLPHKLARQIAHAEAHPDLGLIYSWVHVANEAGTHLRLLGDERPASEAAGADLFEWFLLGNSVPTLSVVVRRECLDEVGIFDEAITYIEDWDLWMRIASRYPVGHVAEPLACYSVRHAYLPAAFARHQLQIKRLYVIEKTLAARPNVGTEVKTRAYLRAHWYSALIDFGIKDVHAAHGWIAQALRRTPDLSARVEELESELVSFAFHLYDDFTPETESSAFVAFVLENLPPELAFLSKRSRRTLSALLSGYAFQARAYGDGPRAKALMRRALAMNPRAAFNIGALTTCLTGTWFDEHK